MEDNMAIVFMVAIVAYSSANYYIARKLLLWLQLIFPNVSGLAFGVLYGLCAMTTIISFLNNNSEFKIMGMIGRLGDIWMGIFFYLFLLFVISDLTLWCIKIIGFISVPYASRILFIRGITVILSVIGLISYGMYHANQIQTVTYDIEIQKESTVAQLNIVLISDLHLGYTNNVVALEKMINEINKQKPDIVLMAGDIFNGGYKAFHEEERAEKLMKSIQSTYGVYACLGNHDAGSSYQEMETFLENSNVQVLKDEFKLVDNAFIIGGRRDSSPIGDQGVRRENISALSQDDLKKPVIMLDHQPANLKEYGSDVDLILSGHTHKGQLFPANLITNAMYTVDYGHYQKEEKSPQMIVTSGIGTWGPPLRIGSDNELAVIHIKFK